MQNTGLNLSEEEFNKFIDEVKSNVISLLKSNVPELDHIDSPDQLQLEVITKGLNNKIFTTEIVDKENKMISIIIKKLKKVEKKEETEDLATVYYKHVREYIKQKRYGPRIYHECDSWVIEEKAVGKTLEVDQLMDEDICSMIVRKAAEYSNHLNDIDRQVLNKHNIFLDLVNRGIKDIINKEVTMIESENYPELIGTLKEMICILQDDKVVEMMTSINPENYPFILAHGDLNAFNILYEENTKIMTLLDFENSCLHPIGYDIAYLLICRVHTFAGEEVIIDDKKWYSEEYLRKLVKEYLSHLTCVEGDVEDPEYFENVVECVKKCCIMGNIFWICWCAPRIRYKKPKFQWVSYLNSRIDLHNKLMKKYFDQE